MTRLRTACLLALGLSAPAFAQSDATLLDAARAFPAMPRESVDLITGGFVSPGAFTFGSGTPFNDLEYTLYDVDYIDGETNGFDTFLPVDPGDAFPGTGTVKLVRGAVNLDLEAAYGGAEGDRVILGTADVPVPFFLRGPDGVDDDYAVVQNVDYNAAVMQLRGSASDYRMPYYTAADGVATEGHYLFYTAGAEPDLVAFVWPCDVIGLPVSGNPPQNGTVLCNASRRLSLSDGVNVRYAQPFPTAPAAPGALAQVGTAGEEIVGGVAADAAGNVYVVGASGGTVGGTLPDAENTAFVAQVRPDGSRGWTYELPVTNGTLLFDAAADDAFLYVAGRTLGALPGFQNAGRWDGILLKLDLATGALVDSDQYGTPNLDGYGNVVLDGEGGLYVSGAGHQGTTQGTDPDYLVAKHATATLDNLWRVIEAPASDGPVFVSEAWGGLSVVPATASRPARLLAGGWYMTRGGSAGFLSLYEGLDGTPTRVAAATLDSGGTEADWVLDNAVGPDGSLYAAGYTTGDLAGAHQGDGDAYVVRFDADLGNPVYAQVGTPQSDMFRKLDVDAAGRVYAVGYTYGDAAGANADPSQTTGDVLAASFEADLAPRDLVQFGTAGEDRGYLALGAGRVVVGGMTEASLAGASAGSFDAFAAALDPADLSFLGNAVATEGPASAGGPSLALAPNPASGAVRVTLGGLAEPVRVAVYDVLGREVAVVHDGPAPSAGLALDAGRLGPGLYLVRAVTPSGAATRALTVVR